MAGAKGILCPRLRWIINYFIRSADPSSMMKHQPLTPREREVLQLVWEGLSTRDIAKKLGRSYNTIAMYRQQIRGKFGVTTTAAVLKIALREGIITEKK